MDDKATIEYYRARFLKCKSALEQISLALGPYDRNPLKHAENVIKDMQNTAKETLEQI